MAIIPFSKPHNRLQQNNLLDLRSPSMQSTQNRVDISTVSRIKTRQKFRRREQNRHAQQELRRRRSQYASDLESKVEELDDGVRILQYENCQLLQRLCSLRASNNALRHSETASETPIGSLVSSDGAEALNRVVPEACLELSEEAMESLYEPYLAIWNLLASYIRPVAQIENMVAVLWRLQAMAIRRMREFEINETGERVDCQIMSEKRGSN